MLCACRRIFFHFTITDCVSYEERKNSFFFFQLEIQLFFSQVDSVALQLKRLQRGNTVPAGWHLHALL